MLSPSQLDQVFNKLKSLPIKAAPVPEEPAANAFWNKHLQLSNYSEVFTNGVYMDRRSYNRIHSVYISSLRASKLVSSPDRFIPKLVREFWYKSDKPLTRDTTYGLKMEPVAIKLYESLTGHQVKRAVHAINPKIPFLITAPDGVVFEKGRYITAIEIKCISHVKHEKEFVMVHDFKWDGKHFRVDQTSPKYGQLQFTMLILNLEYMDLVLHFPDMETVKIIKVKKDSHYILSALPILYRRYIRYVIPHLTKGLMYS